jgi:hypothetical protein
LAADFTRDFLAVEDWFQLLTVAKTKTKMAHSLAFFTLWCIWKQRNVVVFTGSRCSPMQVFTVTRD